MPGSDEHQRRRSGFFETEPVRNRNYGVFRRRHEFTISTMHAGSEQHITPAAIVVASNAERTLAATESGRKKNPFAHLHPFAKFTYLNHFACNIAAQNMRHRILQWNAGAYPKIQVIQ